MRISTVLYRLFKLPQYAAQSLVRLYQKTLSPDHGYFRPWFPNGYCKHTPSCSSYSISAYEKYGFIRGTLKTAVRIIKCNPFSKGGYDPLT